jgi:hypothetical protein
MLRFTIRDLAWLTVVVGISLAWWADGVKLREEKRRAEQDAADYWQPHLPATRQQELIFKYSTRPRP